MKKGLLVVSFGTTYKETREKTIAAIENDLREAFPDREFYRAWTSPRIISRVMEKEGLHVDTVEEAVERILEDGVTDLLVQPTHMMNGFENRRLMDVLKGSADAFDDIRCGTPILSSGSDMEEMVKAVMAGIGGASKGSQDPGEGAGNTDKTGGSAVVLMGHGSPKGPNEVYTEQQQAFRDAGYDNVFIGTVEATPSLSDVIEGLSERETLGKASVILAPFMVVAGDHALKDMTGDGDDTWEKRLKEAGYDVSPVIRGLGEYPGVRALFVKHAGEAEPVDNI